MSFAYQVEWAVKARDRARRCYLIAYVCKSVLWHSRGLLFAFFPTETRGLPPRTRGTLIAVSLFVNAVADVAIGRGMRLAMRTPDIVLRRQGAAAGPAGPVFLLFCATPFLPAL